jgi:hypothetical protein
MTLSPEQIRTIEQAEKAIEARRAADGILATPQNTLTAKLKAARRLSDGTIGAFEIEPYKFANQWGWMYPTPAGAPRWKNANSNASPKYAWIDGKPAAAMFYHASDLLSAIAQAGGVVWYTTEADVWTLREAGIHNAFSTFAETIVPNDLGDMLITMGVSRVLIAPDLDTTGTGWAERIKAALWGSTIELTCYQLPAALGEHGDIGKAWTEYRQVEPFAFWLTSLPQIQIADPAPTHTTPAPVYFGDDVLAGIKQQITTALGVSQFKADNFSVRNISCIFHDDKNPSASLHKEKGLYCHTCGKMYTWKELAGELGIDWTFSNTATITALPVGIVGMSREARRVYISLKLTNFARAMDILIDLERGGDTLSLKEFTELVQPYMKGKPARVVFEQLRGKNLPDNLPNEITALFSAGTSKKQSKRGRNEGRPQTTARIPTHAEITTAAEVTPSVYYGMSLDVISNAANYRAACMADEIKRKPGTYPRSKVAGWVGCSYPTIKTNCKRAGIVRTPQFRKTELTPEEITQLPENYAVLKMTKPGIHMEYMEDERGKRYALTVAGAIQAAANGGGKLYRVERLAADYRPQGIA